MVALGLTLTGILRADDLADIRRVHLESLGGAAKVRALEAIRATGHVVAGDSVLSFEMIAARPNRVRVTTGGNGRTLVQGCDGVNPPWRWDQGRAAEPSLMPAEEAADFAADADFDDPLVDPERRGIALDFAGEAEFEGRPVLRVLVTRPDVAPAILVLDPQTCFIQRKETRRPAQFGQQDTVTTLFGDYRPVDGVALPHRIEVWVNGRRISRMDLEEVSANPELAPETFAMPAPASR